MIKFLKKILRFLMGRFFITSFMLFIELAMVASVITFLGRQSIYFFIILEIISVITALVVLNRDFNPAYKMSFILLVLLVPLVGVTFYYLFGRDRSIKKNVKVVDEIRIKTKTLFRDDLLDAIEETQNFDVDKIITYIKNSSDMDAYCNTETKLLTPGEVKFKYLKEELMKAKKFIFLEYFIIEPGIMWNSILDILVQKVEEGIDVRLMYDDFGCVGKVPYNFKSSIEKKGIKVKAFNPYRPRIAGIMNYRDHRKIAIIDGNVGFLGGINLADEYINEVERFGHWKDTSVMLKGEGVWNLTVLFLQLWSDDFKEEPFNIYRPSIDCKAKNPGLTQVFGDSAFDNSLTTENVYMSIINNAKKYVYITSPYLIIDNEMCTALKVAAKSGIDVRIMVPHVPDKKLIFLVTQSYYKELISEGVKMYEYLPGFLHAKTIVSDSITSMVGTANLDYRSLYLHFEVSVFMYNTKATLELEKDFNDCLKVAKEITLENCPKIGIFKGLVLFLLKAFTPMM